MIRSRYFLGLLAAVQVGMSAVAVQANIMLVNYDSSTYTGGGVSTVRSPDVNIFSPPADPTTWQTVYNFSTTSAFFNTGDTQFDFYGGWKSDFPGAANGGIVNNAPGLSTGGFGGFYGETGGAGDLPYTINTFALWQKSNFQNGGATSPVSFDATTTLSVNGGDFSAAGGLRFVVRNGSTYYVSEALVQNPWSPNIGSISDINNNSAAGKAWAVWTPTATDFSLPSPSSFSAVLFDDVTAVGFVQQVGRDQYHGTFSASSFSVNNALVPEPGTMALLAIGSLIVVRRRRYNRSVRVGG